MTNTDKSVSLSGGGLPEGVREFQVSIDADAWKIIDRRSSFHYDFLEGSSAGLEVFTPTESQNKVLTEKNDRPNPHNTKLAQTIPFLIGDTIFSLYTPTPET